MAYSDNSNVPVNSTNKDKYRNSATLLPLFFRTEANKKFLGSTLDTLISKGKLEKINGFVGSRASKTVKPVDRYLTEPTSNRRRYNLLPSVVVRDEFDDRTDWIGTYDDLLNQLDYFNAKTERADRLFSSKFYAWNPHIDFDKIANYRQYYWLPNGPSPVTVTGLAEGSISSFNVQNQNSNAWVFTPDGSSNNPVIKLFRGATYKFEVNAPGHPFYIKLAKTVGDLDQYEEGITGNGTEQGAIVFTIPKSAPDILYYVCGNHQEMQGIFEIKNAEDELNLDVPSEILGKREYTSSNGIEFTNGLKVNFDGNVTPARYKFKNFYVEGVGKEIQLLPVEEFDTPEGYSQNFDFEFDIDAYDDTPYDDGESSPETPEYVTINRSSIDKNPWSRYNRWFHKDVITKTAEYNNANTVFDEDQRAKRPIIEFLPNIQLYNFGVKGIGNVDLIDTVTTDVFSEVEGQLGYYVDEVELTAGMKVTFNADTDITVIGKIYEVNFVTHGSTSRIHLKEIEVPTEGSSVVVTNGENNQGTSWYFNNGAWIKGQQKTVINQAPLFDLYDINGTSFTDSYYGIGNFLGNKLVSYKQGEGSNDPVLGFPIEYQNVNNIGDIVFAYDWDDSSFSYTRNSQSYVQDTASGLVKINKDLSNSSFESGWSLVEEKLRQNIIQLNDTVFETNFVEITAIKDPGLYLAEKDIVVEYGSNILKPQTGFTIRKENRKLFLDFVNTIPADVRLIIKITSDKTPTQFGYYEPPTNLINNSENNDLTKFTLGSIANHVQTIFETDVRIEGKFNQTSNARDLNDLYKYGRRYVKHQGSLLPAIFGLIDSETNVVKAIRKNAQDYNVFKQQFLGTFESVEITGQPRDDVDAILYKMSLNKTSESPYYYSDMAGFGRSLTKTEYTVGNFAQKIFGIQNNFNLTELSNRSVYVYFNGEHLINTVDYEFDPVDNTVTILRETGIGDQVIIYDYDTIGNVIPNTPTKLGLYPKFKPEIYLDNTYVTPTKVIQGHDGSKTVAYNDYKDDILLELEKRIYNNIKVTYNKSVFDSNEYTPGVFRSTEYNRSEFVDVLKDDFHYWTNQYQIDYLTNNTSVEAELFSYNYSNGTTAIDNEVAPGYWRAVYKKFYDTDRPHTAPWEMIGYSEKPSWWEGRYGPAPYTRGNKILWDDLEKGFDFGLGKSNNIYARPGLQRYIPVNDFGELLSPVESNTVKDFISTRFNEDWVFGDLGPAEYAWNSSSWYPFAQQIAMILMKPANYLTALYDTNQNIVSLSNNVLYKDTGKIIDFTDVKMHTLYFDTVRYFGSGYHVCIIDYLKSKNQNILEGYYNRLTATSMNLTYKTGAFVNKERLRILLESSNPNNPDKSIFLPQENYEIAFRKSNPVSSANISGIIVEKTDRGYKISGYDRYQPTFKIYKPFLSARDEAVTVGGVTANFITWQQEKFYGIGQIVAYEDFYYRVKNDHTTTTTFDQSNYTRLAELPLSGGVSVQKPRRFNETVSTVPYQTVLPNVQEVYNVIVGYQKYLESIGFIFDEKISELGELSNWDLSGKEFLYWTTQNFGVGSIITLSPFSNIVKFKFQTGQVDNVLDSFYEYTIYNASGNPISSNNISTIRESGEFQLKTKDTNQGIYNAQLNLVQKEHVVVFDDKTIFGDIVYDQEAGYRQERVKLIGFKTTEWDGDLFSPGFVYDEAKISLWSAYKDYNLGDVVKYKTKYYSASQFLPGSETFEYTKWNYLENQPTAELLPNLDFKISNFQDFYNLDTETFDLTSTELSQHLFGYQKRSYLDNLIQDNTAQYKFYQGFIKDKGTKNSIDKIGRLTIDDVSTDIEYDEEWAFKVGSLGSTSTVKEIDFVLDEKLNLDNPQAYDFVSSVTVNSNPGNNIQLLANQIAIKPSDYANSPWPTTTLNANEGITSAYVNKLPVAGYPRIDDIPTTAFSYNDMIGSKIINQLGDSDLIWVAKDKNKDWNVYQLQSIPARVIQTDDLITEFFDDEITLNTDIDHNLVEGQIISIKNFNDDVDNVYIVKRITSNTQFVVDGQDASTSIDDSASGTILEFISNRIDDPDNINNIKNVSKIEEGTLVYTDNDGKGKWAVYQKVKVFNENKFGAPNTIVDQQFGYSIATADQGRTIVIGAPRFGDEGQVYILGREFNTGIQTLSTQQGFAISDNASDNVVSDVNIGIGFDVALSSTGTTLVASAPYASNFRASDDSARVGLRVNVGTALTGTGTNLIEASGFTREGVITIHRYDTADNVYKRDYIVGSSDPESDALFGHSVLCNDEKVIVGAPGKTNKQGAVYIFDRVTQADGSSLDWELSDHHTLLAPTQTDGDQFGYSMTGTPDLSVIAVSAIGYEPNGAAADENSGAVFVYRLVNNEYQLVQTISKQEFTDLEIGDQFGISLDMNSTGKTLIISSPFSDKANSNAGSVFYFNRTSDDSSLNPYSYVQTINSPTSYAEERFGAKVVVNPAGDGIAVWSQHGRNSLETTFDKFTRLDDSSLEATTAETVFDTGSLSLIDENYASGTVYTYGLLNTKFVFGQKIESSTLDSFDNFGQGLAYTSNTLFVGAPNHKSNSVDNTGGLFVYQKTGTGGWNKLRSQDDPTDPYSVKKVITYNTNTNRVKDFLETLDPAKGKIPYVAEAEISYKTDVDPATYTQGEDGVTVKPTTAWTENHVGEVWWDVSTTSFIWYEQGDTEYRKTNWGTLFPGSTIDVYEWVETELLPSEWLELSVTQQGQVLGISGTPKYDNNTLVTKNIYNRTSGAFERRYYYWVKNLTSAPDLPNRNLPVVEVAKIIEDPQAYGIKSIQLLNDNALSVTNVKTTLDDQNINLNIQYRNIETDIPEHNEWQIIGENQNKKIDNDLLVKKLIDSFVGYDDQGNPVPDPALPAQRKYGIQIRPRQTMFVDRLNGLKTVIDFVNEVMIKERIVDTKNIKPLNEKDPLPAQSSGRWDIKVDDIDDLNEIGTQSLLTATATTVLKNGKIESVKVTNPGFGYGNSPTVDIVGDGSGAKLKANIDSDGKITSIDVLKKGKNYSVANLEIRPFKVLVEVDTSANNNWAIYEWQESTKLWSRTNTQTYDLNRFWRYEDYVVDNFDIDSIVNYKLSDTYQLNTINPDIDDLIQVDNAGDGNKIILKRVISNGTFSDEYDLMYKANSTIQINTNIYNYQELNFGYAGAENYDVNLFDSEPIAETRRVLEIIRDEIFVDDLKDNWNKLFFIAVRYVFAEQSFVDWAFKTSFVSVNNNLGGFSTKRNYKLSDPGYIEQYLKEVKPYKTVLRNFINKYNQLEESNIGNTDFDVPSYWDDEKKQFISVKITDDAILTQPYINWFDNYKFNIGDISVTDEGAGYTEEPLVVISGGRSNKSTITQTAAFRPLVTTDYTDLRFFVKTTSIPDHGFLRNPGVNTVKAQNFVFEITRTPVEANDKVATPLGTIGVASNGVVFFNPSADQKEVRNAVEYTVNAVDDHNELGIDDGSGHPQQDGIYHYHSDPKLMYDKVEGAHSPILGYALDGYPIYGPYGYDQPLGRTNARVMKSSYKLKTIPRADGSDPDGRYIEDFEYVSGSGDLDIHNGRFCNTPEYPNGTYAYFVTVDPTDTDNPVYPYIIGPTYYGAPILPNGNKMLPGELVSDATAVAYISKGIVRDVQITNPGSGYVSAPTITLAGGGGSITRQAKAYAMLENKKVRINTVNMKFDRLSSKKVIQTQTQTDTFVATQGQIKFKLTYLPTLDKRKIDINIENETVYIENYNVSIVTVKNKTYKKQEGYIIFNTPPGANADVKITYEKSINLMQATDRIDYYYAPTSGMLGKDPAQLMTGVEYDGVQVQGLEFDISVGWDGLPWFSHGWDTFSGTNTDYAFRADGSTTAFTLPYVPEQDQEINVYFDSVRQDPTNTETIVGDGNTATFTLSVTPADGTLVVFRPSDSDGSLVPTDVNNLDSIIQGGNFSYSTATGTRPEDISFDGDGFVTPDTSHAPEEVVPGQIFDSLSMSVYNSPADGSPLIVTNRYFGNSLQKTYSFDMYPGTEDSIFVSNLGNYLARGIDYTVDVPNKTITLIEAPDFGEILTIQTLNVGGANILERKTFTGDGSTTEFELTAKYEDVKSAFVTVNAVSKDYVIRESETGSAVIDVNNPPPASGDVIQITGLSSQEKTYSEIIKEAIVDDGSSMAYTLENIPGNIAPFHNMVIAEYKNTDTGEVTRLLPPDTVYYISNGVTQNYTASQDPDYPTFALALGEIEVYLNGNKLVPIRDFNFDTQTNLVTFNQNVLSDGDVIAITVLRNHEYEINITGDSAGDTEANIIILKDRADLPANFEYHVTTFTNHDSNLIRKEVFVGQLGGTYKLSRNAINSNYVWVELDGKALVAERDYKVLDNNHTVEIDNKFVITSTSKVVITTFSEELSYESIGYRVFNDMLNRTHFKRISQQDSTKLVNDLNINDIEIVLEDASFLPTPNPTNKVPGVVWIDRERIEFYKKTGNKIQQITRGTLGTGIKTVHTQGSYVYDAGPDQTIPYREDVKLYESVIRDGLPNGRKEHVLETLNITSSANAHDQVEVYLGGRKLQKPTISTNPIKIHDIEIAYDSDDVDSNNVSSDVVQIPEFTIEPVADSTGKNYYKLVLRDEPQDGIELKVVQRQGRVWYEQSVNSASTGTTLQRAETAQAKFLLERTSGLPVINIRE